MSEPCIENVESRASRYTGPVPSRRLRESLSPGNRARLMLTLDGNEIAKPIVDLVWVEVTRSMHTGRYHGRIVVTSTGQLFGAGAILEFGPEHVCDWQPS